VQLEPYKAQIAAWLRDEVQSKWTTERIFDELQARGYAGGRTVVKDYVRTKRPRAAVTAEARFYVKPGQQLQVDWADMGVVTIGGVQRKPYAFVAIMAGPVRSSSAARPSVDRKVVRSWRRWPSSIVRERRHPRPTGRREEPSRDRAWRQSVLARLYDVLFATIQHLASQLNAALADLSVERLIEQYVRADLIILDELGFTPLNKIVADHIFRIVSERYERCSIIVTSNKPFELWGDMFADSNLATAVLDRLVHHAHIVPIAGESFRTKDRRPPQPAPPGKAARAGKTAP